MKLFECVISFAIGLNRVCQGLWPSLTFANENIEPQIFWSSSKSQATTTFLCKYFCNNYIGWSNQGKYYDIEMHWAKQDVATWLYDEAIIFQFNIFLSENTGQLAKQAGYLAHPVTGV
jgi:hypothetical protein